MVITCAGAVVLLILTSDLLRRDRGKAAVLCMLLAAGWIGGRAWSAGGGAVADLDAAGMTYIAAAAVVILVLLVYRLLSWKPKHPVTRPRPPDYSRFRKFS